MADSSRHTSARPSVYSSGRSTWRHIHEWLLLWWNTMYLGCAALILLCYPSTHNLSTWRIIGSRAYARLQWPLLVFLALTAAILSVVTKIITQALSGFGLAGSAPNLLVRVLLIEIVPLAAALVVAIKLTIPLGAELALLRRRHQLARQNQAGLDPLRMELVPRLLIGVYGSIMFLAFGIALAFATIYFGIYGYTAAGITSFTHIYGQIMTPVFTVIFVSKAIAFGYIVALIPLTAGFTDSRYGLRRESELTVLARLMALLILVEVLSLVANYY